MLSRVVVLVVFYVCIRLVFCWGIGVRYGEDILFWWNRLGFVVDDNKFLIVFGFLVLWMFMIRV